MENEYLIVTYNRNVPIEDAVPKDLSETDTMLASILLEFCIKMTAQTKYNIILLFVMIDKTIVDPYALAEYLMVVFDKAKLFVLLAEYNKREKAMKK